MAFRSTKGAKMNVWNKVMINLILRVAMVGLVWAIGSVFGAPLWLLVALAVAFAGDLKLIWK